MKRIGITVDCVCDLPEEYLKANGVDIIYFYITTDTGRFRDGYGITSQNLLEYLEDGGVRAETNSPDPREYRAFFESGLKRYDELVHIAISAQVGASYDNALTALESMGEDARRVIIVDSRTLSTGLGHLVLRAVEMRDNGLSAAEIAEAISVMRNQVSTTFITRSADYLCRNGRISQLAARLSLRWKLHPVLMMKDGQLSLQMFRVGNYEKAVMRYIRAALKHSGEIDRRRLFITHAGCTVRMVAQVKAEVEKLCEFDEIIVTQASATVSGNCGPGTIGVLLIHHEGDTV